MSFKLVVRWFVNMAALIINHCSVAERDQHSAYHEVRGFKSSPGHKLANQAFHLPGKNYIGFGSYCRMLGEWGGAKLKQRWREDK